jgi:predicted metalloprotease with PDZ domain
MSAPWPKDKSKISLFLPVWAPGSYLVREYAKNITFSGATSATGEAMYCEKKTKNTWEIDLDCSELANGTSSFEFSYEVYCFELSVRTSFINSDHAFLHLPDLLLGSDDFEIVTPRLKLEFPKQWSKVHTGLDDISTKREIFEYQASDYDVLIDAPIEIGNHDSTGFKVAGKDHHVVAYGKLPKNYSKLVEKIKVTTEAVCNFWGEIPYEHYTYMTHFIPGIYGGLEHLNSTAMQFCPIELETRAGELNYLGLVSHEFFHTWNVKRIRPEELVNFDYNNENYTRMHWLTEGLTSFVDDVILYSCNITTDKEYVETLVKSVKRLDKTAGRKFLSLEDSSFDTWIKLYRPNENSANSNISYYLKGDIAFFCLNAYLTSNGSSIKDFCALLWQAYKSEDYKGISKQMVMDMIKELSNEKVCDLFDDMLTTTKELPLDECCKLVGLEVVREKDTDVSLGLAWELKGSSVWVKSVELDGASYKSGLNAKDEIIAADGLRINQTNYLSWLKTLGENQSVDLTISRLGELRSIKLLTQGLEERITNIIIKDEGLFQKAHSFT